MAAQPSVQKVTKAFHSTPSGSETTAKKPAWWVKLPPSHPTRVKSCVFQRHITEAEAAALSRLHVFCAGDLIA